jgi:hypothetical protein
MPVMRFALAAIALTACGGIQDASTVEQQDGACIALEGRKFESVNELECGRTPTGLGLCKWAVTFVERDEVSSGFSWRYSDVGESGPIECNGAAITSLSQRAINGSFDAVTQKLVWEGQTYVPAN